MRDSMTLNSYSKMKGYKCNTWKVVKKECKAKQSKVIG